MGLYRSGISRVYDLFAPIGLGEQGTTEYGGPGDLALVVQNEFDDGVSSRAVALMVARRSNPAAEAEFSASVEDHDVARGPSAETTRLSPVLIDGHVQAGNGAGLVEQPGVVPGNRSSFGTDKYGASGQAASATRDHPIEFLQRGPGARAARMEKNQKRVSFRVERQPRTDGPPLRRRTGIARLGGVPCERGETRGDREYPRSEKHTQ